MDHNFYEWSEKAEKATEKDIALKFESLPGLQTKERYGKNLRYNSEGIYSYGTKIASLDLRQRTIQKMGYWSPTTSKHFNYAAKLLDMCCDFRPIHDDLVHVQHLSYDNHT